MDPFGACLGAGYAAAEPASYGRKTPMVQKGATKPIQSRNMGFPRAMTLNGACEFRRKLAGQLNAGTMTHFPYAQSTPPQNGMEVVIA